MNNDEFCDKEDVVDEDEDYILVKKKVGGKVVKTKVGNYDEFCGCTLDALRFISEAKLTYNGKSINLQLPDGQPHIESCMHLLGFDRYYPKTKVFRTEGDRRTKENNPLMLIRHSESSYEAQWCEVYAGRQRGDYTPPQEVEYLLKYLSFDGSVIHTPNDIGRLMVESFGNEYTS